jgi:hypothetical protein
VIIDLCPPHTQAAQVAAVQLLTAISEVPQRFQWNTFRPEHHGDEAFGRSGLRAFRLPGGGRCGPGFGQPRVGQCSASGRLNRKSIKLTTPGSIPDQPGAPTLLGGCAQPPPELPAWKYQVPLAQAPFAANASSCALAKGRSAGLVQFWNSAGP